MAWTTPKTFSAAVLTYAEMNTYVRDNTDYLKTHIALEAASELTIASGVVTVSQAYHLISGESGADDELDTISGGSDGMVIILRPGDETITLKDGTGNLDLDGDIILYDENTQVMLICDDAGNWHLLGGYYTITVLCNAFICPTPGTDWTPQLEGVGLAQSKSAKKCWIPLTGLQLGDIITSYQLVGDATEADTLTLDCKLVQINKGDPLTTTDVTNGAITQITADGVIDASANPDDTTMATDKQYTLEIEGTTGTGDSITLIGAEVTILRKL